MKVNSIQVKIVSVIVIVLGVSVAGILYVSLVNQRGNLISAAQRTLAVNTSMLNIVIRNLMLSGEAPIARNTMDSLKSITELEEIALYRTDGSLAFHDYRTIDFVNSYQRKYKFAKTPRVENRTLMDENFQAVLETNTPKQVILMDRKEMEYFFPILNYKECRECHGEANFIRGVAHFKISIAGIFNQIAEAGKLLTAFFSVAGLLMAGVLVLVIRRLIIQPVLGIGKVVSLVGEGNLDVMVTLPSRDELGELAARINQMIAGLKERNRLMLENKIFETRIEESRKYLDNIQEGLLLLNADLTISEQYSTYLPKLFGTDDIAGRNLIDFIYPDKDLYAEERKELEQFLHLLFTNREADMEMLLSINPLQNKRLTIGSREIVIDALFQRIMKEDRIENVMVIFKDMTDIVRTREELEREREKSQSEIEQIAAILKAGPETFADFLADSNRVLSGLESSMERLGTREVLDRVFRDLHSLKGTARYLEFKRVEKLIHGMEGVLAELRDEGVPFTPERKGKMENLKERLSEELAAIQALNERFMTFARNRKDGGEKGDVPDREGKSRSELDSFFQSLPRMVEDIAGELGKKVSFHIECNLSSFPWLDNLKDPIIHLIRNSLDHGIEDPFERISKGKPEEGMLVLKLDADAVQYVIDVKDDGRGIDFGMVRRKAMEKGLLRPDGEASTSELLSILFSPAFSSREEATDISGRGVGLDIVRHRIQELKGKVSVITDKDKGTTIRMRIPREVG
ncbi:MAG: hypothetical protein Kow009_10490 [Spirochaetales bacterium]